MNSPPYGYGGRRADIIVFPVKIIMSPTCSSRFLVGRNARSATARTTVLAQYHHHSSRVNVEQETLGGGCTFGVYDAGHTLSARPWERCAAGGAARREARGGDPDRGARSRRPAAERPRDGDPRGREREHRPDGLRAPRATGAAQLRARSRNVRARVEGRSC